jgi:hypothetical protein
MRMIMHKSNRGEIQEFRKKLRKSLAIISVGLDITGKSVSEDFITAGIEDHNSGNGRTRFIATTRDNASISGT